MNNIGEVNLIIWEKRFEVSLTHELKLPILEREFEQTENQRKIESAALLPPQN